MLLAITIKIFSLNIFKLTCIIYINKYQLFIKFNTSYLLNSIQVITQLTKILVANDLISNYCDAYIAFVDCFVQFYHLYSMVLCGLLPSLCISKYV